VLQAVVGKGAMKKFPNPVTNGAMNFKRRMFFLACRKWRNERSALLEPALQGYFTPTIPMAGRFSVTIPTAK
jgi:hypothetical protein